LARNARDLPWAEHFEAGQPFEIKVTCKRSRVRHTGAVEERIREAIETSLSGAGFVAADEPTQVIVRINNNICTVSVDTSGALLHQRGYRKNVAKAPLRETLAAGVLAASGWKGDKAFMDPMCGSGTLAIEAALLAANRPPGAQRRFAFMSRPDFDEELWGEILENALSETRTPSHPIMGSDRDAGAVSAASENSSRAGVEDFVDFAQCSISAISAPADQGMLLCNPPYGRRIGQNNKLRDLYAALGNVVRASFEGWDVGLVATDKMLVSSTRLGLKSATPFLPHGGLKVQLFLRDHLNPEPAPRRKRK